ncbi:MAG: serine/threonine-protein kinase, partial [candidate division Zixibacteria bacterium]|nr:serine/threonine-protein kinase [candidate division Zixibacteria bacterium]
MQPDDDKTQTRVTLASGTMVSHYRIIEKIGAGGMGEVYLAEDTKLDRKVALKFLPLSQCADTECRERFTREAQSSAKLDHPNIVSVFEVGEFQERPFFSMQHVEGQTLKEVLSGKALPLDRILEIGIQVCDGLQAAHEKGITHRDIKPSNILIDSHGRARIVDFGLA